jgi:peptidoglycan/xylan/chitin deacetylase (PgdA/CDA1 family)
MKKLLIVLSFLILLIASFFIGYKLLTPTNVTKDAASPSKVSEEKSSNQPDAAKDISGTTAKQDSISQSSVENNISKAPSFYDILGSCTKPKKYPDAAMSKWRIDMVSLAKKYPSDLFINGQGEKKVVALTFDDGPDPVNTPKILKILRDNNVHATFFCIGKQIEGSKSVIEQAYNDGDVIGSHSWSHKDFTTISTAAINDEVILTENKIYKIIGIKPALIRPPYGSTNDTVENTLTALNYKSILWSIDTLDWEQREPSNILSNVIDNVRPGEIILMHCDGDKKATTEALPNIIIKLKEMGYNFVTVDKLLNCTAYK